MSLPFKVAKGTESNILAQTPVEGQVWFALDTKKIYYSDGFKFISMGGNSSIYYGTLNTEEADDGLVEFVFSVDDIEQQETGLSIPLVNDLILNSDGCFYRVKNIEVINDEVSIYADKLTLAGGGGSGGSGSGGTTSGSASVEYIKPTALEAANVSVLTGAPCELQFKITALDSAGDFTSGGFVNWKVNGVTKVQNIPVVNNINTFDIGPYLANGQLTVLGEFHLDVGTDKPQIIRKSWTISVINIELIWEHDYTDICRTDVFPFTYTAYGTDIVKSTYLKIDNLIDVGPFTDKSNTQKTLYINRSLYGLTHGVHTLTAYVKATVNGVEFTTDEITHKIIFVSADLNAPIVLTGYDKVEMTQYNTLKIPVVIYNPLNLTDATVILQQNGETVDIWENVQSGVVNEWLFTPSTPGSYNLTVACGGLDTTIQVEVEKLDIDVVEPGNCILSIKANAFPSNEALRKVPNVSFSDGFDWVNGGLKSETYGKDNNSRQYICVKSGSRMFVDGKFFDSINRDKSIGGRCFKIIFKVTNCAKYDADAIVCTSENDESLGLHIKAQDASLVLPGGGVRAQYCENSYIEYEVDIDMNKKYMITWLDGVPAGIQEFSSMSVMTFKSKALTIGSDDCDVYIYAIKLYDLHLSNDEHLNTFILDAPNALEILARFTRNDILDERGEIDYRKLILKNPDCYVQLYDINKMPRGKKLKNETGTIDESSTKITTNEYILYKSDLTQPIILAGKSTSTGKGPVIKVLGTSSSAYGVSAFNLDTDFKKCGIIDKNGEMVSKIRLTEDENEIPVNYFNTKVNVASCESANNAINADWYNTFLPFESMAKKKNKNKRDTMKFYPAVTFITDRNTVNNLNTFISGNNIENVFKDTPNYINNPYPKLYAVGNIGNSKKNLDVLHDTENEHELCIEVTDNQSLGQWMTMARGCIINGDGSKQFVDITGEALFEDKELTIKRLYTAPNGSTYTYFDLWTNNMDDTDYDVRYANNGDGLRDDDGNIRLTNQQIVSFYNLVNWFAMNDTHEYDPIDHPHGWKEDTVFDEPITFEAYKFKAKNHLDDDSMIGSVIISEYAGTYTHDCYEYRMAKMLTECEDYLVMDSFIYHYLFIERHTMIDNVAKNTFWTVEDWDEARQTGHWSLIKDYDNDTADGNDNSGALNLTYGIEVYDKENENTNYFNAIETNWLKFIDGLTPALRAMYRSLEEVGAWSAETYLNRFEQFLSAIPERCWIEDYYRKYIRPNDVYKDSAYFLMLEAGKKTHQRKLFETYLELYLATKYQTASVVNKSYSINIRGNASGLTEAPRIPIKVYSDCYVVTQWADTVTSFRAKRGESYDIRPAHLNMNDETLYWYAPQIYSTIGDLGVLNPKIIFLTGASRLREFAIGETIPQQNLNALSFTGNTLLLNLKVMNCIALGGYTDELGNSHNGTSLDLSTLTSLKTLNTQGSKYENIILPNGAPITKLHLNDIGSIIMLNLRNIEEFSLESYDKLTTVIIENTDTSEGFNSLTDIIAKNPSKLNAYQLRDINWFVVDGTAINEDDITITYLEKILQLIPLISINNQLLDGEHSSSLTGSILVGLEAYNGNKGLDFYNKYIVENGLNNLDLNFESANSKLINVSILNGDGTVLWQKKTNFGTQFNEDFLSTSSTGAFDITKVLKSNTLESSYSFGANGNYWSYRIGAEEHLLNTQMPILNIAINEDIVLTPLFTKEVRKYNVKFLYENGDIIEDKEVEFGKKLKEFVPKLMPHKDDSALADEETYAFIGYALSRTSLEPLQDYQVNTNLTFYPVFKRMSVYDNVMDVENFVFYTKNDISMAESKSQSIIFTETATYIQKTYHITDDASIDGYYIAPKEDIIYSGKITLPRFYNNKPVIGIAPNFKWQQVIGYNGDGSSVSCEVRPTFGSSLITHIFWQKLNEDAISLVYDYYEDAFSYLHTSAGITNINYDDARNDEYFKNLYKLQYVEMPDSIKRIGNYAFYRLLNVRIAKMPSDLLVIGAYAFAGVAKLNVRFINANLIKTSAFVSANGFTGIGNEQTTILTFTDKVEEIDAEIIKGYGSLLTEIQVGSNIKYIESSAFSKMGSTGHQYEGNETITTISLGVGPEVEFAKDVPWMRLNDYEISKDKITINWNTPVPSDI